MQNKIVNFFKAPVFLNDEEKTLRARALHALHINMGGAAATLGILGVLFVFPEKRVSSLILVITLFIIVVGMIMNRRGYVKADGILLLSGLWSITILMACISGGIRSLDIIFFVSGTVIAGIIFGARGTFFYAGLSLLTGLVLIFAGNAGVVFPQLFTFPPVSAWIILFINLVFTIVPLQVALQNLSESVSRAHSNEERYRLITSVMSDYAFSIQYAPDGKIIDQWISGAFEAITGYTSEEFIARGGWPAIVHPDDQELDKNDMAQLRANQKVVTEIRLVRKDGGIRWVRSYGHPLWDHTRNQLAGIYGAVQDITVSKEVENNLLQRAEEMSLLYQISLALTSGQDLYHALRAFVKELKRVMTVDAFHIGLYDPQTDLFSYSLFLNLEEDLQLPPRTLRDSPGLTWEVISTKQTLYLPNVLDPQTQRAHNIVVVVDVGIHSYIGIPLMLQDSVIGIMSVQSCQINAYTADKIRLLETLAAQVAITIEKSRLFSELQVELVERQKLIIELEARNAEAETLRESVSIVASTLERSEAVQRILEQLKRVVAYDSASVWLYKDNKAVMVGWNDLPNEAVAPGEYTLSDAEPDHPFWTENASYILLDDIQEDYPVFRGPSLNYIHGWMAIPLWARGKLTGFISLDSRTPGKFTRHDAKLALTFADQVSIALENARLFADLQNELEERRELIAELETKNAESETLRESVAIVASTLEKSEAIDRILEQLERVLPYNSASVQLVNDNMLEIVSARGFNLDRDDVWMKFKLNEDEPAYPVLQGRVPYILYDDVQVSIPTFNDIPHNNIHAWMAVPLKAKGKIMGIIALDGYQVSQFPEKDAQLAVTYANQAAIALENARLFTELQEELSVRQKLIEELESKNAELERFTYTVSHDLRSPLVTIKGFLGFMERSARQGNMEGFRKDMQRVGSATDRMDNLLKDLLELSRIGRLINKPEKISFEDLAHEALEIVHGRIQQRGITVQIQPGLPAVYGDRTRLMEVLQNLLDNAAKYAGGQKNPIINIGMNGYDGSNNPIFFIRDNGMGIDPQYHERIFGMFDKLDPASEGTGIGLALVKRIIEFHGGRLWVESEAGKGSTFFFTMPHAH